MISSAEIIRHIDGQAAHPRWDISSNEILQSAYLQKVGILEENEWIVRIRGLCLQVSAPRSDPHIITVLIKKPLPGKIQHAKCTCTGGKSGKCKHAVAVLKSAATNTTFEPWTCTTGSCTWNKKELKRVQDDILKPVPVQEFCHHIKKRRVFSEIENFFDSHLYEDFKKYIPADCAYSKFMMGRGTAVNTMMPALSNSDISPEFPGVLCDLYKVTNWRYSLDELIAIGEAMKFALSKAEISNIQRTTCTQAQNPQWFKHRIGRITGSTAGPVVKVRSFTSNISLLKRICYPSTKLTTPALRYGRAHERDGLALYEKSFEHHVNFKIETTGLFIHDEYPWLAASPDALASCDCCGKRVVEIKCPYNCSVESTKEVSIRDLQWMPLTRNSDYYCQMQLQMLCVGVDACDFVVWAEKESHIERHSRDSEKQNEIIQKSKGYFYNAVIPELLGKYHTRTRRRIATEKKENHDGM